MTRKLFPKPSRRRRTNTDRLLSVLSDNNWHSTKELAHRVGHTFAVAKFKLIRRGYIIERERHARKKRQYVYRLLGGGPRQEALRFASSLLGTKTLTNG